MPDHPWRKSSYSEKIDCVEVACTGANTWIRDSKHPAGATLSFTERQWNAFLATLRTTSHIA